MNITPPENGHPFPPNPRTPASLTPLSPLPAATLSRNRKPPTSTAASLLAASVRVLGVATPKTMGAQSTPTTITGVWLRARAAVRRRRGSWLGVRGVFLTLSSSRRRLSDGAVSPPTFRRRWPPLSHSPTASRSPGRPQKTPCSSRMPPSTASSRPFFRCRTPRNSNRAPNSSTGAAPPNPCP